jgi:hypothetical protein
MSMKIIVSVLMAASLMACGGKKTATQTPAPDTTQTAPTDGTGGATYGGATTPEATPAAGTEAGSAQ